MATFNVYELRNETLKEACVLKSRLALPAVLEELSRGIEPRIAHWRWKEHSIRALDVELSLPDSAAEEFIQEYLKTVTPRAGWRLI